LSHQFPDVVEVWVVVLETIVDVVERVTGVTIEVVVLADVVFWAVVVVVDDVVQDANNMVTTSKPVKPDTINFSFISCLQFYNQDLVFVAEFHSLIHMKLQKY
jgi:hypothetical protein